MLWWRSGDALVMLWWRSGDALVMLWWCFGDTLVTLLWCSYGTLVMLLWRSCDVLVMLWWCAGDALVTCWRCSGDALVTLWWCSCNALERGSGDTLVIFLSSTLAARLHLGRQVPKNRSTQIQGNKQIQRRGLSLAPETLFPNLSDPFCLHKILANLRSLESILRIRFGRNLHTYETYLVISKFENMNLNGF
jgi:hypothetical protein